MYLMGLGDDEHAGSSPSSSHPKSYGVPVQRNLALGGQRLVARMQSVFFQELEHTPHHVRRGHLHVCFSVTRSCDSQAVKLPLTSSGRRRPRSRATGDNIRAKR